MDAKETLRDITANIGSFRARLALFVGRNTKKVAAYVMITTPLAAWKVVGWFV